MPKFDGPPPPAEGQVCVDPSGSYWKVRRLTIAEAPAGFYLVHLSFGVTLDNLIDSMVLGPREFAALIRERDLRPHLRSV